MSGTNREELVEKAQLAEQAKRYDDVFKAMKVVAKMNVVLGSLENNLFAVGCKNVIDPLRHALGVYNHELQSQDVNEVKAHQVKLVKDIKKKLEKEMTEICQEIIFILKENLIPHVANSSADSNVFYNKMIGDYYRYMAEFSLGDEAKIQSLAAYQKAEKEAKDKLLPAHPTRLGVALNFSAFHYEILRSKEVACSMARQAIDEASEQLESMTSASYRETSLIVCQFRQNLELWTSDGQA